VKQLAVLNVAACGRRIVRLAQACLRSLGGMGIALKVHPRRRYSSGITLLELITVMTLAAILMAIGVPSFRYVTTANRIAAEVNGLVGDLQYARAEAIKEGANVVACASTDGATCSNANTWQNGWVVCSDVNNSGSCDAGEPLFRVQKAFFSTDTFTASGNTSSLSFNREGFAVGLPGIVTIALHSTPTVASFTRCVTLSAVGTTTVQSAGQGNCT
jgi:type IV fimbrial biogenesis protein FimT